ncbi:SIR2 family protein [Halomonas sp. B23F22_10]|uniref:SIR2 family protein n=1 Tax=Halomonas sp. B23F22_10 TaxID=3459515 RepID=UPI00373E8907
MISWPDELVDAIARRRCVVFFGSGVSRNSVNGDGERPCTWQEFLEKAAETAGYSEGIRKYLDVCDYLTACEVLKRRLGVNRFSRLVLNEFQQKGFSPAPIHEHIYNLDCSVVATPNFDNIYEQYASGVSCGTVVVKDHTSNDLVNYIGGGDYRVVIKTHGQASNPNDIIFSRSDYAKARTENRFFYELLKSLALTHTFLFVGCGLDDPDIRTLFEDIQFAHGYMPHHYMTIPDEEADSDLLDIAKESMMLEFLVYASEGGHVALTKSLEELVETVVAVREGISENQKW